MMLAKREQFRIKLRAQQRENIFMMSRKLVTVEQVRELLKDDKLNELEELTSTASIGLLYQEGGINYFYQKFDSDDIEVQNKALRGLIRLFEQFPMNMKKLTRNQFASELLSDLDTLPEQYLYTRLVMLGRLAPQLGVADVLSRITMTFYKFLHSQHEIIVWTCLNGLLTIFRQWHVQEQRFLIPQVGRFFNTKYQTIVIQLISVCIEETRQFKDFLTEIDFIVFVPKLLMDHITSEEVIQILCVQAKYTLEHLTYSPFLDALKKLLQQNNIQAYQLVAVVIFRSDINTVQNLIAILDLVYYLEDLESYEQVHMLIISFIKNSCENFFTYTMKLKLENMALGGSQKAAKLLDTTQSSY